jgi:hypothetical protein
MSWAAVFWILYGVGSTLFVVYLFRLGNSVVSSRDQLVEDEFQRNQLARIDDTARLGESAQLDHISRLDPMSQLDDTAQLAAIRAQVGPREPDSASAGRLHVERIFQPSDEYVAVQGVRNGATCVINLPVGLLSADSQPSFRAGRAGRER